MPIAQLCFFRNVIRKRHNHFGFGGLGWQSYVFRGYAKYYDKKAFKRKNSMIIHHLDKQKKPGYSKKSPLLRPRSRSHPFLRQREQSKVFAKGERHGKH